VTVRFVPICSGPVGRAPRAYLQALTLATWPRNQRPPANQRNRAGHSRRSEPRSTRSKKRRSRSGRAGRRS